MPHKHTRREKDYSTFDLPPSQFAKPLPVTSQSKRDDRQKKGNQKGQKGNAGKKDCVTEPQKTMKRKRDAAPKDDAPRAFKRMMAYAGGKKPRSGLDDGTVAKAKAKKTTPAQAPTTEEEPQEKPKETPETLTIRPGERMSEFAARVDAALPLGGLINKTGRDGKDPLGLQKYRTRKERKMHKLYDEWREEERKIKEEREEEEELAAERELEEEEAGISWKKAEFNASGKGKKKKGKGKRLLGESADAEEDPWEALKRKRGEARPGLHDVNKAPPELHMKLPQRLMVRGAGVIVDGIPKAAGSLRKREELQGVRDDVVAQYRKLMESKRPSLRQT